MADRPYMTLAVDPVRNDRIKLIATWHLLIRRGRGCGWGEPGRFKIISAHMKVQVGKDQENAQSERDSHSKNQVGKKLNEQAGTYTMKTYRKSNEQLFSQ